MRYRSKIRVCMTMLVLLITLCCCSKKEEIHEDNISDVTQIAASSITIGNSELKGNTDVVLVMDESGSMVKADKERLAIEAAKLFVDMEKTSGTSIALVEFSNQIISTGLIDTNQQQNKNHIKEILGAVQYSGTAHTDTGAGLLEAISILENSENENDKAILLFTDGKTDIDIGTPGRTTEDSINDVNRAVQIANEKGYKIYCIGLNADGKVDEQMLQNIATTTGGQYKIATNVNELPDFFNSIFANMDQSEKQDIDEYDADGNYHDVHFEIDNSSVMEANIVILSSKQLEDVILTDPSGNLVNLQENENVTFSNSAKYSLVKLFYPTIGEWSIQVKGVSGDHIKVSLIYNYDIDLAVDVQNASVVKGRDVVLKAYLVSKGETITDKEIYQNLSGYVNVVNKNTGKVQQETLELNEEGDVLMGRFNAYECALYDVSVHVEGSGFYRDSEVFSVEASKMPPSIIKNIEGIELQVGKSRQIDLTQYFEDIDGDSIEFVVQNNAEFLQAELQKGILLLNAELAGNGTIVIFAQNGAVEQVQQEVEVVAVSFMQVYGKFIILLVIVLIVVAMLLINNRRNRKIYGSFQVNVVAATKNPYGTFDTEDYIILNTISAESLGKHGFAMSSLLKLLPSYYMEIDAEKKQRFMECLMKMETEAARIKIIPNKKAFEIAIKNKSSNAKIMLMNNVSDRREIVIDLNDSKFGISNIMEKEFGVRFLAGEEFQQINFKYKKM